MIPPDTCDLPFKDMFDTFQFEAGASSEARFLAFLKTATKGQIQKALGAGLEITLPFDIPVPIGGNFSDDQWREWEEKRHQLTEQHVTHQTIVSACIRKLNPEALRAWENCKARHYEYLAKLATASNPRGQKQLEASAKEVSGLIVVTLAIPIEGGPELFGEIERWSVKEIPADPGEQAVDMVPVGNAEIPKRFSNFNPVTINFRRKHVGSHITVDIRTSRGPLCVRIEGRPFGRIEDSRLPGEDFGSKKTVVREVTIQCDQTVWVVYGVVASKDRGEGMSQFSGRVYKGAVINGTELWSFDKKVINDPAESNTRVYDLAFPGCTAYSQNIYIDAKAGDTLKIIGEAEINNGYGAISNHILIVFCKKIVN